MTPLQQLAQTIAARAEADPGSSWTAQLLAKGPEKCAEKFGEEAIEVQAGRFDALHFRFVSTPGLPQEHPPYDVWCTPDDFLFLRGITGGYMRTHYELASLRR